MSVSSVFLSFSTQEEELAASIRQGLQERGIKVWKAPEDIPPGSDWAAAIHLALTEQEIFLLLWTDASMASDEVTKEITLASRNRMKMIPLRLTAREPDSAQAYHLAATQWLEGKNHDLPELLDLIEERIRQAHVLPVEATGVKRRSIEGNRIRPALVSLTWLLGFIAVAFDLNPWLGLNQNLLNQRLFWQARWRQLTQQPGPSPQPITLMPLGERIYEELEIQPTDGSVNQAVLAEALTLLSNSDVQRVGLDFILDGEGSNPEGHLRLVNVITKQSQQRKIFAGLCPPNSEATKDCLKALDQRLPPKLAKAGAIPVDLGLGVSTEKYPPLQLSFGVRKGSLATALAEGSTIGELPSEAVIDWSVNWLDPSRITLIKNKRDLTSYRGKTLLIASDGYKGADLREPADQHLAPHALKAYLGQGPERFSTLQEEKISGGVMQAVLAQSLSSRHWLRPLAPFNQTLATVFAALMAWGMTKKIKPRQRRWFLFGGGLLYSLLVIQLAVSLQLLVPVALPIAMAVLILAINQIGEAKT